MPSASRPAPARAVVVGSGFGGLAAAVRLAAGGVRTLLLERHAELGGRAGRFVMDGFAFDRGPTVVTAPEALRELFALAGRRLEDYLTLLPVDPMYRLRWEDGEHFDYTADGERLMAEIARLSPDDVGGYQKFYRYARRVYDKGYRDLCHVPFLSVWDMVKVAPALLRLKAHRPVYATVARYLRSEKLRQAFSFNSLLIGGNPFSASSIYTLIHPLERLGGVHFPKGGTYALVEALARLFTDLGGEIRREAPVSRIVTANGRVRGVELADGSFAPADVVVSNGDVVHTHAELLAGEPRAAGAARRLARRRPSMSLFIVYFGTRRSYPGLLQHNVLFGARYRELLRDIFDRGVVADDFSLYLHAPTLTDPSLAPPGGHTFYALAPVPHLGISRYDWEARAEAFADRIIGYLDQRYMPGLARDIVVRRTCTPLDFQDRLSAFRGAAFSLAPTLLQSAYFRVHNRSPRIGGLYFVGAGTHPGAGIPGVIGSAKATAGLILGDEQALVSRARTTMRKGSLSFTLAAKLAGGELRRAIWLLYSWCRHCDDVADKALVAASPAERHDTLDDLRRRTLAALGGAAGAAPAAGPRPASPKEQDAALPGAAPAADFVFAAFAALARGRALPAHYPLELLEGMRMDVDGETYPTFDKLRLYCYRVAGTVGLMFSHLAGVSDEAALRHAADLGTAMQLTNIARDVMEDAALGRVYLPGEWLAAEGLAADDVAKVEHRAAVARVVARLLDAAEAAYASGDAGLRYLPWRAALAVAAARKIYAAIGTEVRRRGPRAWDRRCYVPLRTKLRLAAAGAWLVLRTIPGRTPWRPAASLGLWRFQ